MDDSGLSSSGVAHYAIVTKLSEKNANYSKMLRKITCRRIKSFCCLRPFKKPKTVLPEIPPMAVKILIVDKLL